MVPLLHRLIPGWGSRNGEHSDASSAAASALLGESPELLAASGLRGFLATQPLRPTLPLESLWQSGVAPAEPPADGGIGAGGACGDQEDSSSSGDSAVRLEFPCALRPAVGAGKLDLQLRLFQLHVGEPLAGSGAAGGGATRSASSSSNANCSSSTTNSSSDGDTAGLSSLRRCAARTPCSQPVPELLSVLDKAAGLLAAHLLFPGAALPAMRLLAAAHCASAAVQVAGRAVRAAAPRGALKRAAPLPQLADAGRRLARLLQQHGEPALLLLAAAALWVHVHPTSAQIGKCVAGELGGRGPMRRCRCCPAVCWPWCLAPAALLPAKHGCANSRDKGLGPAPACSAHPCAGWIQPDGEDVHPDGAQRQRCRGGGWRGGGHGEGWEAAGHDRKAAGPAAPLSLFFVAEQPHTGRPP